MKNKKDDRYQNQPFLVRVYRWIRWKPLFFIKASYHVGKTLFDKDLLWDSDEKAYFRRSFIFRMIYTEARTKMKHYYHYDEVFGKLKI